MPEQARRGFMPTDKRDFAEKALPVLRKAAQEIYFLINRGYPVTSTTRFVGDRYQLSERQRLALARTVSPQSSILSRKSRQVQSISGETVFIDGFNVLIGLEIAFSDSMLFKCMDSTVRRNIQTDTADRSCDKGFAALAERAWTEQSGDIS